jgi:hypothetical protein
MPRAKADHDFMTVARRVVEQAIGERLDGRPLEAKKEKPATANRGHARAAKLTPDQRRAIARKAAQKRWGHSAETKL